MTAGADPGRADQVVLFHVSDLHIGTSLMPPPSGFHRFRSGFNPHDYRLLRPLQQAFRDARRRVGLTDSEPLNVVMSGDLTQSGVDNDYATALALLHQRWQWRFGPLPRWIGLGWSRERTLTVPGNHDHWRREGRQRAFTRGLAPFWFEFTPWKRVVASRNRTIRIELFGVDSNSGLEDAGSPGDLNLFAGGAVSAEEIEKLEDLLAAPQSTRDPGQAVVRVLVCHHAFSNSGGFFAARPLSEASRGELTRVAARNGVSIALTGHTHSFHEQDWTVDVGGESRSVKELRCATTLQGTRTRPGLQGFWVHHITREARSQECRWTAWKYQAGGKSFDVDAHAPVTFVIPAERLTPAT